MRKAGDKHSSSADHAYWHSTALPRVLREWRLRKGLKISAVAGDLRVSTAAWGHWETGARFPQGKDLIRLSAYTGIPLPQLICPHAEACPLCVEEPAAPHSTGSRKSLVVAKPNCGEMTPLENTKTKEHRTT